MKRKLSALAVMAFFSGLLISLHAQSKVFVVENLQPGAIQTLPMVTTGDAEGSWEIKLFDADGRIPEGGCLNASWQQFHVGITAYSQSFRAPGDAVRGEMSVNLTKGSADGIKISGLRTENRLMVAPSKFTSKNDYSGFDERSRAMLAEKNGAIVLLPENYGYALSEEIPLEDGAEYQIRLDWRSVLIFDKDRKLTGGLDPRALTHRGSEQHAYMRILVNGGKPFGGAVLNKVKAGTGVKPENKIALVKGKNQFAVSGKPAAAIIVDGSRADSREHFAAYELRRWIREVTGASLPVYESDIGLQGYTKIYVGHKWAAPLFGDRIGKLADTDGFAFSQKGEGIYIYGANPKGTMFGVWNFIEENLDLIWSRPQDYGAVFEPNPNAAIRMTDKLSIPVFRLRSWSMPGGIRDLNMTGLHFARLGCSPNRMIFTFGEYAYMIKLYGGSISVGGEPMRVLSKYKKEHPEFYPLIGGVRKMSDYALPCLSNPEVEKKLISEYLKMLCNAPDEQVYLMCGLGDSWDCCECESCMAPLKLPDGSTLAPKSKFSTEDPLFRSTQYFMFINRVAEAVEKEFPNAKLLSLGYIYCAEYPKVPLRKNVISMFAPYPTHNMRIPLRDSHSRGTAAGKTWSERFADWIKSPSPMAFYEYYSCGYFNAMSFEAAENMRDALNNVEPWGMNSETLQDVDFNFPGVGNLRQMWDVNAINAWVISKLMWNPKQDVQGLRDQFIRQTYREAAPEMSKFWKLISDTWHDPKVKQMENCHSGRSSVFQCYLVNTRREQEARELLVQAEKAARNPNSKKLIQDILRDFDKWSAELGRLTVPGIDDGSNMSTRGMDWEKACVIDGFYLPRQDDVPKDKLKAGSGKTEVRMLYGKEYIYFKFHNELPDGSALPSAGQPGKGFPNGEHVELLINSGGTVYHFALGPDRTFYVSKGWDRSWQSRAKFTVDCQPGGKSWDCVIAVPLDELNIKPDLGGRQINVLFARIYGNSPDRTYPGRIGEESTYRGINPGNIAQWSKVCLD